MLFLVGGRSFWMGIVNIFFIDTKSCLWCCGEVPMETSSGVNSHLIFDHPKQKNSREIRSYQWVLIKSDHTCWRVPPGIMEDVIDSKRWFWVLSKGWTGRMFPEIRFVYSHGQHGWKVLMFKRDSNLFYISLVVHFPAMIVFWSIFMPTAILVPLTHVEDLAVSVISTISQTLKVLRCMSHANKRLSEKQQPAENLLVYTCVFSPPHPLFFPVWKNLGEFSKKEKKQQRNSLT